MNAAWLDDRRLAGKVRARPAGYARRATGGARFVELPSAVVRVRIAGEERGGGRPTIVLTPDPPNVIEHHERMIDLLAERMRVVCFELPGFGFSLPRGPFGFTVGESAKVVVELLEHLGLAPYALAMSCVAGFPALEAARLRPDLVRWVVAVQTPSFGQEIEWARRVDFKGLIATRFAGQLAVRLARRKLAQLWYGAALAEPALVAGFLERTLAAYDDGAEYCLASAFQAMRRGGDPGTVPLVQGALRIWGAADRTHRRTDKDSLATILPGSKRIDFEGAGHFPELEAPARFRDAVVEMLGSALA